MDINSIINVPSSPSADPAMNLPKIEPGNHGIINQSLFQQQQNIPQPPAPAAVAAKSLARRSTTKEGKQKLFQCTGFGDCKMVFTRSEHLARHARKHTGEKPFRCVVPSCNRMFSRFDNMMQHTQTHSHRRDHSKQPIILNTDARRQARKSSVGSSSSLSSPVSEHSPQLPSPQLAKPYPLQIPPSPVSPHHQHPFLPPLTIPSPTHSQWSSSLPVSPVSPISPYSPNSFSPIPSLNPLSMSDPTPTHSRTMSQPDSGPVPRISNHAPRTASDPTPYVFTPYIWPDDQSRSHSPPPRVRSGRRLSIADLCNPIETLMRPGAAAAVHGREGAIELTEDEIEALQGFSQFHCYPVKKEEIG